MSFEDPNSSMPTFLFTASALLFLSGVIKLLVDRSCYMFKPTKSKLKTDDHVFHDVHESDNLQDWYGNEAGLKTEKNETGKRYRCESGGNDC